MSIIAMYDAGCLSLLINVFIVRFGCGMILLTLRTGDVVQSMPVNVSMV